MSPERVVDLRGVGVSINRSPPPCPMSALGTELGARIHLGQPLRPMTDTMAFVGALDQGTPDPYARALDAKKKRHVTRIARHAYGMQYAGCLCRDDVDPFHHF